MKKTTILVLMVATIATTFNSCKKGEDDPFLSLRSRDGRLMREWVLDKYDNTQKTIKTSREFNTTITKTTETTISTSGGKSSRVRKEITQNVPGSTTSKNVTDAIEGASLTLKFEKNGKFTSVSSEKLATRSQSSSPNEICFGSSGPEPFDDDLTCDGTYNFINNVFDETTSESWNWVNSNQNKEYINLGKSGTYYIKRLTAKELVLEKIVSVKSNLVVDGKNLPFSEDITEVITYKAK